MMFLSDEERDQIINYFAVTSGRKLTDGDKKALIGYLEEKMNIAMARFIDQVYIMALEGRKNEKL